MKPDKHVVAVILAAGASRRFGAEDKRLARLPSGQPLLAAAVANAAAVFSWLRVVIRDEDDPSALGLASDTPIIRAHHAVDGLGASLADAFTALENDPAVTDSVAAAVLLGDMPSLSSKTLQRLCDGAQHDRILRPRHGGRPGHPVLFGRAFWHELTALGGDEGARAVVDRHRNRYREVAVNDPEIHRDIDTAADLAAAALPLDADPRFRRPPMGQ